MSTQHTFDDLFTYTRTEIRKYPSHSTVRFVNPVLLRDVEIELGKIRATIKSGTKLEAAVWMTGHRLQLKCSFGTEVPLAEKQVHYEMLLSRFVETPAAGPSAAPAAAGSAETQVSKAANTNLPAASTSTRPTVKVKTAIRQL